MKNRHLRLVVSNAENSNTTDCSSDYKDYIKDFFNGLFVSKNEKIYIIKDCLTKIYKDYEDTTGIIDVPYFVKAERRISQIIKSGKINYYYNKLKKINL